MLEFITEKLLLANDYKGNHEVLDYRSNAKDFVAHAIR